MSTPKKPNLRIALVQCSLFDLDPQANLQAIANELARFSGQIDLAVLPEACLTGFSEEAMNKGEVWHESEAIGELQRLAKHHNLAIACSVFIRHEDKYANRFLLIEEHSIQWQDKRHLFRMGGEARQLTPASERKLISFKGWNILPIICYDLRFPVWCRCKQNDYDIAICVANWPKGRRLVWSTLLQARAMENLCYTIGVNRVGTDMSGLSYTGDSALVSPRGEVLASCTPSETQTSIYEISYAPLEDLRQKFPVWLDADDFTFNL